MPQREVKSVRVVLMWPIKPGITHKIAENTLAETDFNVKASDQLRLQNRALHYKTYHAKPTSIFSESTKATDYFICLQSLSGSATHHFVGILVLLAFCFAKRNLLISWFLR